MKKTAVFFEKCVYSVLLPFSVFVILASIAEPWIHQDVNGPLTIFLTVVLLVLLSGMVLGFWKLSGRGLNLAVAAGVALAFLLQLWIVFQMRLMPKVDLVHIYKQCVEMLENGSVRITDIKYYSFNTNNIPITIVLYWVFRFSCALGFTNYRLAGGIINVILLCVTYFLSYRILRGFTSVRTAAAVLLVILANPVFYAYAAYYYTDTISLSLTIISVYLALRGVHLAKWKRAVILLLAGLVMGLAVQVRVTSIFIVFSLIVCSLVQGRWKKLLQYGIWFLGGALLFLVLWSGIYAYHVQFDTTDESITVEHFLMMGSAGRGTYNLEDVKFTKSFPTHEEKVRNNLRVYRQRLRENGLWGNLRLAATKEAIVWGIGSRGYAQYTKYVEKQTKCYDWIVGKNAGYFQAYMQSYNIVLFCAVLLGLWTARKKGRFDMLLLAVYWGGAVIFYLFWEAHPRQSVSLLPFLAMLAAPWIERMEAFVGKKGQI